MTYLIYFFSLREYFESESKGHSVVSDSLWPHGPYSAQNSPGQNTGVDSLSFLQGIFPTQRSNPGLHGVTKSRTRLNDFHFLLHFLLLTFTFLQVSHLTALMFLGYSLTGRGNTEGAKQIKAVRWGGGTCRTYLIYFLSLREQFSIGYVWRLQNCCFI